jgi:hypothetical protein
MWGIRSIRVVSGTRVINYEVGSNGIDEIMDNSREYPDHTEFIFDTCDKNGDILNRLINCPVDIAYDELG